MFTRSVYISHISKHDQLSDRSGPDNMGPKGHNLLFVNFTFICHFNIETSLKKTKAERPQVNKLFALLMMNSQHI